MKSNKKPNIGIVAPAQLDESKSPVLNLINILYPLSNNICLITLRHDLFSKTNKIHTYEIQYKRGANAFTKIIRHIYLELRISYKLAKITKNVDFWIFFISGFSVLPVLTAKLLRKKVVLALSGSSALMAKFSNDILSKPIEILEKINLALSNCLILYSPNLVKEYNMEKYRNKISIAHRHFLDFNKFKIEKPLSERDNLLGYIGRLSQEKGILNFVEAMTKVLEMRDDIGFLIGGDGPLRTKVEQCVNAENLNSKARFVGWIPHDDLPKCLNDLKLLVLPSYTEGLPNIMLEAMACGTPVLATPVGAIPDVIKHEETGFIMEDNSPECIASNVLRVLSQPNLEEIAKNAHALVEKEYTYEAAVEKYRSILGSLE